MLAAQVLTLILVLTAQGVTNKTSTSVTEQATPATNRNNSQSKTASQNTSNVPVFTMVTPSNTSGLNASSSNSKSNNSASLDIFKNVLVSIQELPGIILFGTGILIGIVLITVIFCIIKACQRGNKRRSSYPLGGVEMTAQLSQKADGDTIRDQEAADGDVGSAGQLLLNGDGAPKEAEYSDLDFSVAKNRKTPVVGTIPETEYAEIKIENHAQIAEEDGGIMEVNHETPKEDVGVNEEEVLHLPPEEAVVADELSRQITDES